MSDHAINMFWSDEDQALGRRHPRPPVLLRPRGDPQEALAEVLHAKTAWLESAGEHGDAIPEPRYRPAIYAAGSSGYGQDGPETRSRAGG